MGEGLREVSQRLAMAPSFLGIEPEMIRVAEHLLELKARIVQSRPIMPPGARHRFHELERTEFLTKLSVNSRIGGFNLDPPDRERQLHGCQARYPQ